MLDNHAVPPPDQPQHPPLPVPAPWPEGDGVIVLYAFLVCGVLACLAVDTFVFVGYGLGKPFKLGHLILTVLYGLNCAALAVPWLGRWLVTLGGWRSGWLFWSVLGIGLLLAAINVILFLPMYNSWCPLSNSACYFG